jgi:Zn-dependent peptidase ImmA (M78 family)/plasmid maintenance system antidote protein VapI
VASRWLPSNSFINSRNSFIYAIRVNIMVLMERIQSINPKRIAWCCADRGITPEELASEIGIARATIERVMASGDGLTFKQLHKLAGYFDRGVLFFLEQGPVDEVQAHTPQFRTLANQKPELSIKLKALIERVEKQREVYLSLREDLDDADRPKFRPPELSRRDLQEAARVAREWLGLAEENSFDTYRAAIEARGMLVFRSNGYNGKWQIAKENPILGFALYDLPCPLIVVKKQRWESRQAFTLMHELGHLLLHKASSIDDEQDLQSHEGREREANAFAGHMLVPDAFLTNILDAERPDEVSLYDEWLEQQRKAWGVSGEVILRRLLDAGRLSQSQYAAYRQWWKQVETTAKEESGSRKYRHREPKHVFGDTFVRTVLDALNARHITLAKASSYLDNLKIDDLHQLERHYAGL